MVEQLLSLVLSLMSLSLKVDNGGFMHCSSVVSEVVSEQMLTVGQNLDRPGQKPLPTYLTLILSILILILSHLLLFYSDYSYLFYSWTRRISHFGILHS
jgi:hypothetical protein